MIAPFTRRKLILLAVLSICTLCSLLLHFQDKTVNWVVPSTEGWVKFEIPRDARQIHASVQKSRDGLNVCNQDGTDWSEITIKVTGIYNTPYLAQPKPIRAGACEDVPYSDFAESSWKRMQMPPNQTLTKIELLVSYVAKGYDSLEPK